MRRTAIFALAACLAVAGWAAPAAADSAANSAPTATTPLVSGQ